MPHAPYPPPRPPKRPPTAEEIAENARQLEIAIGAQERAAPKGNWKTSVLGILAIVASVAGAYLEKIGYDAPPGMVTLIVGLLTGGGLIAASDGHGAGNRYRPASTPPDPRYLGDYDPFASSR